MKDIAFVNVSFREPYVSTQKRLAKSIADIYPDAEMFFWTDELPPGSKPFQESLYGFKVHAIEYARQKGYKRVVWIDTCAVLKANLDHLFDAGFIAVKDENKLYKFSGKQKIENKEWNLVGGSLYLFDFDNYFYDQIYNDWKAMEAAGDFGTQEFIMNEGNDGIERCGHRMDETCMALCIYVNGAEPDNGELYSQVCEKKHFLQPGETGINNYIKG